MILQILTGLHAHPHSRYRCWDDGVVAILWWSFSGASLGPFSQTYYTLDAMLGHISVLDEICRSSRSRYPHLRGIRWDDDVFTILWWSLSGAPVEPLIQVCISRHRVVFILSILRDVSWMFGFDLDHRDHMSDDRWLCVTGFLTYRIFDATLGHLSISGEVWRSPKSYMIVPTYGVRAETMTCSLLLWWFLSGASRESSS